MSLAVFLTAFGGVAIGFLAVIHQSLRMRAVRNAEVHTGVVPEEVAVAYQMDDQTAADADLDQLLAQTQTAIIQGRIEMAEYGIKTHSARIKKSKSPAAAELAKIESGLYRWRYKSGETIPLSEGVYAKANDAIRARVQTKSYPTKPGIGKGLVYESAPSIPPRRNPASPAKATDLPPPSKVR